MCLEKPGRVQFRLFFVRNFAGKRLFGALADNGLCIEQPIAA